MSKTRRQRATLPAKVRTLGDTIATTAGSIAVEEVTRSRTLSADRLLFTSCTPNDTDEDDSARDFDFPELKAAAQLPLWHFKLDEKTGQLHRELAGPDLYNQVKVRTTLQQPVMTRSIGEGRRERIRARFP